jgi:5-methylthioadenosine/S-adenosylhomocysteine deaminase
VRLSCRALADWERGFSTGGFSISVEGPLISAIDDARSACGLLAVPGLVEPHVHLCQTLFRGAAEGLSLLDWLSGRIWPLEAAHSPDTLAASVLMSLRELLAGGCTCLLDMGSVEDSATTVDILRRSGIRAFAGNSLMDTGPASLAREPGWLREECARVSAACGDLVGYAFAPRFAPGCSDAVWEMAREHPGAVLTTHCSESPDELRHPSIEAEGGNVRFLDRRGFLGPRTILAHMVHPCDGELEILAGTGTAVAHCPWANLRLGSGIADVPALAGAGVPVFPASDGAACNNRLDPAGDARLAMGLADVAGGPGRLDGRWWMRMATEAPGAFLGTGHGRLAPGWRADIALLEPDDREWDELAAAEDPLRYILELDWPSRVRTVVVDGRVLMDRGTCPTLPPMPSGIGEARAEVLGRAGCSSR